MPEPKNPTPAAQHPILAAAIRHQDPATLRHFSIPEWVDAEGRPFDIHFYPWTLDDQDFFERRCTAEVDGLHAYADVFIRKAVDEHGSKLFDITARKTLIERVDPTVLIAACRLIMATRTKQDAIKNSMAIPDAG